MIVRNLVSASLVMFSWAALASGDLTRQQEAAVEDAVERAIIAGSESLAEARKTWESYGSKPRQRWIEVANSVSDSSYSVDLKSPVGIGPDPEIWVKSEFNPGYLESAPTAVSAKQKVVVFCNTRETAMLAWSTSGPTGEVIASGDSPRSSRTAVTPDSIFEAVVDFVCGVP